MFLVVQECFIECHKNKGAFKSGQVFFPLSTKTKSYQKQTAIVLYYYDAKMVLEPDMPLID